MRQDDARAIRGDDGVEVVAKELGAGFCRTLFGERYEDVQVAHADFAWSRWFFDIAWDRTWVISDKREQRVTVLCTSDTD